jgi:hypothetical protein
MKPACPMTSMSGFESEEARLCEKMAKLLNRTFFCKEVNWIGNLGVALLTRENIGFQVSKPAYN